MRTLFNNEKSSGLLDSSIPEIKWKLLSQKHIELEWKFPKVDRYPVLHCLIRPDNKLLVAGSMLTFLDFIFDLSLLQFSNLDYACPKIKHLFENTFSKKRNDAFVTRAIEPYSREVHWFICVEICEWSYIDTFNNSRVVSIIDYKNNEKLVNQMWWIILLGDKLLDEYTSLHCSSTFKSIADGIVNANKKILRSLFGSVLGSFTETPKLIEFLTDVVDWGEKIEAYEERFRIDDLYEAFLI